MNIVLVICFLFIGCLPTAVAAVRSIDGKQFSIGNWSDTESILLPSDSTDIQAQRRILPIINLSESAPQHFNLILLSSPSLKAALLVPESVNYFIHAGQISALRLNAGRLELAIANLTDTNDASLDIALEKILGNRTDSGLNADTFAWNPMAILGMDRFKSPGDSRPITDLFSIKTTTIAPGVLEVELETFIKRSIKLTIDTSYQVIKASENGSQIPVLRTGRTGADLQAWSSPQGTPISFSSEMRTILTSKRSFNRSAGPELFPGVMAARAPDGDFWIGPRMCSLALFGGHIIGVRFDDFSKLRIFRSKTKIPPNDAQAFENQLRAFEVEAKVRNTGIWNPETIELASLFPDRAFTPETDVRIHSVTSGTENLQVEFKTDSPRVHLLVNLDSNFVPISASIIQIAQRAF